MKETEQGNNKFLKYLGFPGSSVVKNLQVPSLSWEDPLKEGMAAHPSILPGKTPWTEKPGGLQSREPQRGRHDRLTGHSCMQTLR